MLIDTGVSAGTTWSPRRQGTVTRRPMIGITGRERIPSWIVCSTTSAAGSSPPPPRAPLPAPPAPRRPPPRGGGAREPLGGGRRPDEPLPGPGQLVGRRLV